MARPDLTAFYPLVEGMAIALDSLRANRVRAGLTILGIAVGVFVVVVISAAIHGVNASVAKDLESTGPTTFFVSRYPISFEACDGSDETCRWLHNPPNTLDEVRMLGALPSVAAATARLQTQQPARYMDRSLSGVQVFGQTANWTEIDGGDIAPGRSFTDAENSGGARVVLVNDEAAKALFGESDPIDKTITVAGAPFRVIGVYHYQASFLAGGNRARLIVPIEAAYRNLRLSRNDLGVAIKPVPSVSRDEAIDDVTAALRARRRLRPGADNNFAIITQDKLFEVYNKIFGMFGLVMVALASVGLLVGGVGVVAIMMISVTERTREIGVRKALGATRTTILLQFLIEAVTLTAIGAAVGLLIGWGLSALVRALSPVPTEIPPLAILAALGASVLTGVVFGIFPAFRAARLDPVEALRYE